MGNLLHRQNAEDLIFMNQLLESGKVVPVIDSTFPLNGTPEAFRYFGQGHARGKVVITIDRSDGEALGDVAVARGQKQPGGDS